MGAIADGMLAYAQPLLDQTDGSHEQLNKAMAIVQLCFNLALLPEGERTKSVMEMQASFQMDDEEFASFVSSIILPMIQRHHDMFPRMHRQAPAPTIQSGFWHEAESRAAELPQAAVVTDRYAPCPCNSGKKYKFCCGMKRR